MVLPDDLYFKAFLDRHESQLLVSAVPKHFWFTLYEKLENEIFDAGNVFTILKIEDNPVENEHYKPLWALQVTSPDGISCDECSHIYLVDHAWTYEINQARSHLSTHSNLLERMTKLMGIDESLPVNDKIHEVLRNMWMYNQTYSIANAESVESRMPIWYITDEVGVAIMHSDTPNFRAIPIFHHSTQQTFTVIFPIENLDEGDFVTRDYVESITNKLEREALLIPWKEKSLVEINFNQMEPDEKYFLEGHIPESLPLENVEYKQLPSDGVYKVYSEYEVINDNLKSPRFTLVTNQDDADILWIMSHFKNFRELSTTPGKFINQFPYEYVLTIKDLLAIICRRNAIEKTDADLLQTFPVWLPTTYNLKNEISKFVSYYQNRERRGLDNHWIVKPWNLARSLDTYITNDIKKILRLSVTGPKLAQKYIENPLLFYRAEISGRVKFDIRYVLLFKSSEPLRVSAYRNFFLRFANKPFELNDFDDYEKHFTVMNYQNPGNLCHMLCADFLREWAKQYPAFSWAGVEKAIFAMLREVFECAVCEAPPKGIPRSPQSRAVYAVDLMLAWTGDNEIQPKLLEINWAPDCKRACDYYPDFYDAVFTELFLNEHNEEQFADL